jgi:glutamate racemase
VTEQVAKIYLGEAFSDGFESADVLLLGCTHYPLLKRILHGAVPKDVTLVDSAESTALAVWNLVNFGTEDLVHLCSDLKARNTRGSVAAHFKFFVTDSVDKFRRLGKSFLGQEIADITHVDIDGEFRSAREV